KRSGCCPAACQFSRSPHTTRFLRVRRVSRVRRPSRLPWPAAVILALERGMYTRGVFRTRGRFRAEASVQIVQRIVGGEETGPGGDGGIEESVAQRFGVSVAECGVGHAASVVPITLRARRLDRAALTETGQFRRAPLW